MPEKTPSERLDDCEEIQKNQQTELVDHGKRLGDLEAMQLETLKEDIEILILFANRFLVGQTFRSLNLKASVRVAVTAHAY